MESEMGRTIHVISVSIDTIDAYESRQDFKYFYVREINLGNERVL